jgi:RimJ/RimL family protein N-acetyltransferase
VFDLSWLCYSGLRLPGNEDIQLEQAKLVKEVAHHWGALWDTARKEQFVFDEWVNNLPIEQLLFSVLHAGEIRICHTDGKVIGFVAFRDLMPGRSAHFEAFAFPKYRKTRTLAQASKEAVKYAFDPWPQGLGLQKLKAEVSNLNQPGYRGARAMGFEITGYSQGDGLFQGVPTDMIALELLNPIIFGEQHGQAETSSVQSLSSDAAISADADATAGGAILHTASDAFAEDTTGDTGESSADFAGTSVRADKPNTRAGRKAALRARLRAAVSKSGVCSVSD